MERRISLEEISDGKRYGGNDLVKAGCRDCHGCSVCCRGMGSSILLDPYDVYRLSMGLVMQFGQLMAEHIELHIVDGMIIPNLKMDGIGDQCTFLDGQGRCRIHAHRPGFCRLFPLGRIYEDRSFRYFLQIHECPRENRTKVKVRKWIDTPDFPLYERFSADWHYFLGDLRESLKGKESQEIMKTMNMYVLNQFYVTPYCLEETFYPQFYRRLRAAAAFADGQGMKVNLREQEDMQMELDQILKERRSIRRYKKDMPLDRALVEEMLRAAIAAPSWKNSQTSRYYVVMSGEMLEKVRDTCLPEFNRKNCQDAGALIITAYVKNHSGYDNQRNPVNEVGSGWGCYDLGLHDSSMILKAKDLGLDTLIMGIRDSDALRKLLDIGMDQEVVSVIAVGYRDADSPGPGRKSLEEVARFY